MRWVTEYWDEKNKNIRCYGSSDFIWKSLPKKNFLYLYVVNDHYEYPYGIPGTEYITVVSGWDYYMLFGDVNDKLIFGGWNDEYKYDPDYPQHGIGRIHELWSTGKHKVTVLNEIISFAYTKEGVELEEPWATACGFMTGKRTLPSCLELK